MDKEEIKRWLTSTGHDREWLAGQIGCTVGTLNQWFSKLGFPDWASKSITRLANPTSDTTAGLEVQFTASEFELIEKARALSGHPTRAAFYEDAITEFAQHIITREEALSEKETDEPTADFAALPKPITESLKSSSKKPSARAKIVPLPSPTTPASERSIAAEETQEYQAKRKRS